MKNFTKTLIASVVTAALFGCGGGSDSGAGTATSGTTPITISVSDAPVDNVTSAVVVFSKVALLPVDDDYEDDDYDYEDYAEDGRPVEIFTLDPPMSVDLLKYQGSATIDLVTDRVIEEGDYKVCVFAHDGLTPASEESSHVIDSDGNIHPLTVKGNGACPQGVGSEEGAGVLYFNESFSVSDDNNDFVIEFNLRRGLRENDGEYTIQRTSVDILNTAKTGELEGDVSMGFYGLCEADTDSDNGFAHAVYLYNGNVVMDDMGPFAGEDGKYTPIYAANVNPDGDDYEYDFGYLVPGTYSIGYTCTANDDSEEGLVEGEVFSIYSAASGLVVVAGEETEYDFGDEYVEDE